MEDILSLSADSVEFQSSLYAPHDTSPHPTVNATYRRSYGTGRPFQPPMQEPLLPASLRPQLAVVPDAAILLMERRVELEGAAAGRERAIEVRAGRAAAERQAAAEKAAVSALVRAERRAAAASGAEALRIQKDYNTLGRW